MERVSDRAEALVVGAGPTGLMLAVQLARRGVRPVVIDRNDGPARESRALGVQARTLEIYDRLGISAAAVEHGRKAVGATMWAGGKRAARVPLGDIGRDLSPFPYLLILGQDANERLLLGELTRLGVPVHRRCELMGLSRTSAGVQATVRSPTEGERPVSARWVCGCDGSRSAVRSALGIAFEGAPYEHVFFVADVAMRGPMVPDELNIYLWRDGFHLAFPMRGRDRWRIAGILPKGLAERGAGVTFADVTPSIQDNIGSSLVIDECGWFSIYRIHHRRAARFRDGGCFLLGDAAHVHSPVGAQGMNTGLQDAYNLAWKLALVARGRADEALLDTYAPEREPVADRLLRTTDRAFQLVVSTLRAASVVRTRLAPRALALAMRFRGAQRLSFRTVSQTGIHYRASPLSRSGALPPPAPQPGDRFPWIPMAGESSGVFSLLDDTRFTVMRFDAEGVRLADRWGADVVAEVDVPLDRCGDAALGRVGVARASVFLVRPDGYIAASARADEGSRLDEYLSGVVGLRAPSRRDGLDG